MFRLEFDTDNAAFESQDEVSLVLYRIAHQVDIGSKDGIIHDSNGNTIGKWKLDA